MDKMPYVGGKEPALPLLTHNGSLQLYIASRPTTTIAMVMSLWLKLGVCKYKFVTWHIERQLCK